MLNSKLRELSPELYALACIEANRQGINHTDHRGGSTAPKFLLSKSRQGDNFWYSVGELKINTIPAEYAEEVTVYMSQYDTTGTMVALTDPAPTFESVYDRLIENYKILISVCDTHIEKTAGVDKWYWNTKRTEANIALAKCHESIDTHRYVQ